MGNPLYVFGVEILLQDHASPVVEDATIGLYNINSVLAANSGAGTRHVTVSDGSEFSDGEVVTIIDDNASEVATIAAVTGNTIAFKNTLTNAYTTAASATVHACSRFRWLQQSVTGVTNWCATMLVPNGISAWTRQIDLSRGGNIATPGKCSAVVKNTSKFWDSLQDKVIYLNGMVFCVWEFQGASKTRQWWGICEKPDWDTKTYKIPAKGALNRRKSNLGTLITQAEYPDASGDDAVGKMIPVTFGEYKPKFDAYGNIDYDSYAQFVRVANKISTFGTIDDDIARAGYVPDLGVDFQYKQLGDYYLALLPGNQQMFPVVGDDGDTPPRSYNVKLGTFGAWYLNGSQLTSGTYAITYFNGDYINVGEGTGEDEFRKIEHTVLDLNTYPFGNELTLAANSYFQESPVGNATATEDDNSWVALRDIRRTYRSDVWPCKGYLGQTATTLFSPITNNINLYGYQEDKSATIDVSGAAETVKATISEYASSYVRLPDRAFGDTSDDNNKLDIEVNHFDGDPDNVSGAVIVPPKAVVPCSDVDTTQWDILHNGSPLSYRKTSTGEQYDNNTNLVMYSESSSREGLFNVNVASDFPTGGYSNLSDRDSASMLRFSMHQGAGPWGMATIIEIIPPTFPTGLRFDSLHLGVRMSMQSTSEVTAIVNPVRIYTRWRRFIGPTKEIGDSDDGYFKASTSVTASAGRVASLPGTYYIDAPNDRDKDYYFSEFTEGELQNVWTGHVNFEFEEIDTEEKYNSIQKAAFIIAQLDQTPVFPYPQINHYVTLNEFAFIFKRKTSIKKYIYTPYRGRVFDSSWDGRKVSTDIVERPLDVLEHTCRLQNWGESSKVPTGGWGVEYAEGARIAYTGRGSWSAPFFDANITPLLDLKTTNQIQKQQSADSDKIKKTLCRNFFLAQWADKDGRERVARIVKSETSPSDIVTLADIIDRASIDVSEPDPADVYCAPFVRYQKNFATGEYQKAIRIFSPDSPIYDSSYVDGMSGYSAEEYWNRCHTLWGRIGFITAPPSDMTDLDWANGEDGDKIAKDYLTEWIDWMFNPEVSFKVHYLKAGGWEEAHKFILQLPHQTDDAQIECVVTKVSVSPNPPYAVSVTAIMLRETIPEDFFIKDTMTQFGTNADWVDTMTEYSDDSDKVDQM